MSGRPSLNKDQDKVKIFNEIINLQFDKKGGRIRLKDIDVLLENSFDIHYKTLSGVHDLVTKLGISWISVRSKHPKQDLEA